MDRKEAMSIEKDARERGELDRKLNLIISMLQTLTEKKTPATRTPRKQKED